MTVLRKIVSLFRRYLSQQNPNEFLRMHAVVGLKSKQIRLSSKRTMDENLRLFLEATARSARSGGYSEPTGAFSM